jgi:RNA polymerase sigma factor (sigma-70 family)
LREPVSGALSLKKVALDLDACNKSPLLRVDGVVVMTEVAEVGAWPDELVALYQDQYASYVQLAFLLLGSRAVAEEVVQDAFVVTRDRWATITTTPGGYVRAVVVNGARGRLRRRGVEERHVVDAPPPGAATDLIELRDSLARLSLPQRTAIVLRYWAGAPDDEIADVLGCRPATVRSHLARGLARLRKEIQ